MAGGAGKAAKPASPTPIFENSITMDHAIIDNEYVDHWMQTVKHSGAVTPPDSAWIEAVGADYVDLAWTVVGYVFWYHVWAEIDWSRNEKHWLWMTRVSDWWAVDGIVRARVYMHPDANPTGWAVTSSYGTIESEMAFATPLANTITGIEPTQLGNLEKATVIRVSCSILPGCSNHAARVEGGRVPLRQAVGKSRSLVSTMAPQTAP